MGLDMVGALATTPSGFKFLQVPIDKFTKWIEVKPVTSVDDDTTFKFISGIVHRFGVPNNIIINND